MGRGFTERPDTWMLIEVKTSNSKSFRKLQLEGCYKAKPIHYAQMQMYMEFEDLDFAMYICVSKETDDIYCEVVSRKFEVYEHMMEKAEMVLSSNKPFSKISKDPDLPPCGWCSFNEVCHRQKQPEMNCRTCVHATPVRGGEPAEWRCEFHKVSLSLDDQAEGCDQHLFIPDLIGFALPIGGQSEWITYAIKRKNGEPIKFANGSTDAKSAIKKMPVLTSREIACLPRYSDQIIKIIEAMDVFGGGKIMQVDEDDIPF